MAKKKPSLNTCQSRKPCKKKWNFGYQPQVGLLDANLAINHKEFTRFSKMIQFSYWFGARWFDVYLTETPDFTPLVRYIGQFEEEDANADPILAIARFIRYVPALKNFLNNRCQGLLQQVYQRNRELNQEHKNRPLGSNPVDHFEHPVRGRGDPIRADFEGAGAQFQRDLQAGKYPDLVDLPEQQTAENLQEEVEEGQPSSGWRPTLRLPAQPSQPPPDHPPRSQGRSNPVHRLPSPPSYPPPDFSPALESGYL